MSRNEKFWVDQVTPPPPPRGTTRGGEQHGGGILRLMRALEVLGQCDRNFMTDKEHLTLSLVGDHRAPVGRLGAFSFFLVQTKMSWHSLFTSQYSR